MAQVGESMVVKSADLENMTSDHRLLPLIRIQTLNFPNMTFHMQQSTISEKDKSRHSEVTIQQILQSNGYLCLNKHKK